MGSFLFKWEHPAREVYVTGTFDDWARSVKLESKGKHFEKLVELPLSEGKIHYKFVVDEDWTTDHTAPQETDSAGNVNNVLLPENIIGPHSSSSPAAAGIMSGVTPQSTTAGLAGQVPKEGESEFRPSTASSDVPGSFPETPFHDAEEFAVNPIPATSGTGNPINLAPGDEVPHPNTLTSNTIQSNVRDDPSLKESARDSEQTFGVAPLPATAGTGNPVSLQPGEKVPHPSEFTSNTINSNVTTDKDSYDRAGGAPQLPNIVTPDSERHSGGMFSMPGISGNMIPESSLPMGEGSAREADPVTIQSAGANSTTAGLAGQVPLEPRGVPEVVSESQQEAGVEPEAAGNRDAVKEKTEMEKELESKVPEEPATSEGTGGEAPSSSGVTGGEVAGMAAGGAALGGAGGAAYSHGLPSSVQASIDEMNKGSAIAPTVPDVVQESITDSHVSPEAAGNETMVGEKSAVEKELLKEIPREDEVGKPAPSSTAALSETAPAPTGAESAPPPIAKDDAPVTTAAAPAQTPATQNAMKAAVQSQPDSRDISPMSKPIKPEQSQPAVTTGVGASSAPAASTPAKPAPVDSAGKAASPAPAKAAAASKPSPASTSSAAASTDKKSKRASGFFGKLKSKFSDKDKK
ncbi:hypothetical protein P7C71_g2929, partial [Lecanoromycetidae sp. Uapishka_2]